jgi:glycosyltransferase involved in cell wall biosynthesis
MGQDPLVIHDSFMFSGGGEKVAMILAEAFNARLWSGHVQLESFPDGYFERVMPKSLNAYGIYREVLKFSKILQMWRAFAHFPKKDPLWTVFSGSLSILAYKRISGRKILYCFTPPRLLYDLRQLYHEQTPLLYRPGLSALIYIYRKAYKRAIQHMDVVVAISEIVRDRIDKYLGKVAPVIYPPVETCFFKWIEQEDFYLSTGRVDPLKRVDLIVKAFKKMPEKNLIVVSGGTALQEIRTLSCEASNIRVLGWVGEKELRELIGRSIATIYIPRDEDFGMSPVESMAAGKPVIGVQEGGLLETVGEGESQMSEVRGQGSAEVKKKDFLITECGVLVPPDPTVQDIVEAVKWMTPQRALGMRDACEERAKLFDKEVFIEKMREVIEGSWD